MKPSSQRRIAAAFVWLIAAFWLFTLSKPSHAAAGLVGTYYNNATLTAPPVLVRTDATVNFNYGNGSPDPAVTNADYFSIRWTGVIRVATTGSYTFQTNSDDGTRLYVNGVLVIDDWNIHSSRPITSSAVSLTAGVDYAIKLEYFDATGAGSVSLSWLKPGDSSYSVVPASNGSLGLATGTAPMLEYLFEEASWNGTAGEVKDTSGNGWNATAGSLSSTKPTTTQTSPALGDSGIGTCRYGVFNRANKDYLALPSVFPNLGSTGGFTVTAWIRSTNNGLVGQRIFIDDENGYGGSNYGYILSLGDSGAGKLHYFTRMTPSNGSLDTGSIIANNTWYFIAFGVDLSTKTKFLYVYNAAGTQLAAVSNTFSEANLGSDPGIASIGGETNSAGGAENTNGYGFSGNLDEVRAYPYALTAGEIATVRSTTHACPAALVAEYHFEDASYTGATNELADSAGAVGGPYHGNATGSPLPNVDLSYPAISGTPGTCGYATEPGPSANGGGFIVPTLPLVGTANGQATVAFWMYWDSSLDNVIPVALNNYTLWMNGGSFGFNSGNSDIYGIPSAGLANGWHHVVAVFTNGNVTSNLLYIDGVAQTLTQRAGSPSTGSLQAIGPLRFGGFTQGGTAFRFKGRIDEARVYSGVLSAADALALTTLTHACAAALHHLEIRHATGTGLTCTPSTVTIAACRDAACSSAYTDGVSGTLTASGTGMTVNWPGGAAFTIAAGSSTTTGSFQVTTVGNVLVGSSGVAATGVGTAPSASTTCTFGSPSCTFATADSGLLFDVPNHRSDLATAFSVTAVKKSDNSAACVPAFASVSKPVTFKCGYANPSSGTLPVRIGGVALNAANSTGAACDAAGGAVTLAFDGTGTAQTSAQYADAGQMTLTATYTGSGSDAGLVMTGSDSFVAAPLSFSVSGPAGTMVAGTAFSATVAATNVNGAVTPNFGRESTPESATLGFVRTQPAGSGAVNGSFTGSVGAFANGAATATNLVWTEVGRGDVTAVLASGSYLGTGMSGANTTAVGGVNCASQGGTCALPSGAVATIYYGAAGRYNTRSGMTGNVACTNATFGDPYVGYVNKVCVYVVTSGASTGATGAVGPFRPHHFDVVVTPACGAFSYAGQPFAATATARNAAGATTLNYDGSAATSPNFAKTLTLSDTPALGVGSLAGGSLAATAFTAGIGAATPTYTYSAKLTGPKSLVLRGVDADSVSSAGYAEGSTPLRSGRLRLVNGFGAEAQALQLAVWADYWSGNAWVPNSADSCTTLSAASVAKSNQRDRSGNASSAWSTSASGISLSGGQGTLTLTAPGAGNTGTLDLSLNLGATAADQSCAATHPASTGSARPWLRSFNGACAATADRDPMARASFGIYSAETKKTVHVREVY